MSKKLSAKVLAGVLAVGMLAFAAAPAGAQTIDALLAQIATLQAQLLALQGGGGGAGCYVYTRDLTMGSQGADVTALQTYLQGTGHFTFSGGATGYFGSITQSAVAAWQASNGVAPAAGYFGPISRAKYNMLCSPVAPGDGDGDGDGDAGDFFGGTAEGFLDEFDQLSGFASEEVGEGEEDATVLGIEFEATDADQLLERVTVIFDAPSAAAEDDLDDFIEDTSVWLNGDELGRMDVDDCSHTQSTDTYTCRFINLNGLVEEDSLAELLVAVSGVDKLGTGIATNGFDVNLPIDAIRAASPNGVVDEYDTVAYDEPFTLETFASATGVELDVKLASDNPDAGVVNVDATDDTDNVVLLRGTIEADGADLLLHDFPVLLTVTGATDVDAVANRLILDIDGNEFSETVSTAGVAVATITFDDLDLDLSDGDELPFEVLADINDIDAAFDEGDTLRAELRGVEVDAIVAEDESGEDLAAADLTGTALGENMSFYDIGIMVTLTNTSQTVTVDDGADNDTGTFIIEFEIEAFDGTVYVSNLAGATLASSIDVATIDESTEGGGILYRVTDSGTATADADLADAVTFIDVVGDVTEGTNIVLDDGEVAEITLTVTQTNNDATDDGLYQMFLQAIGWDVNETDDVFNVYDFDLEDYRTDPISLN